MDETAKHPGFFKTSWQSTEKTFMKSSWINSAELPEDMKIALEPGAMLEGYSQPSQNNHVKFAEALLNGEPVRPEICFINRGHWKRLAIEEPAPQPAPVEEPAPPPVLEETSPVIEPEPLPEPEPMAAAPEPEPVMAAAPEPEPIMAAEPEPEPEPEPVMMAPEPMPEPAFTPAAGRELPPRRVRAHFLQKISDFFAGKN